MNGSIPRGTVLAICGVLLVGCGTSDSNETSTTGGSRDTGPASTLPSIDMASELDPSMTSDEGGDRLGTMSDSSTGEVSETVKEWISEYEIRLGEFKAVIADIKPKLVKSTNEDVRMLILRAENTVVDLEHRVNALATISEVEATARKLGIDKLMTDVDTIIKESLQMAQTPSRGG